MHREIRTIRASRRWVVPATLVTISLGLVRPPSAHAAPTEPTPTGPVEPSPVEPDPAEPDSVEPGPAEPDPQVDAEPALPSIEPAPPPPPLPSLPPPTPIEVDRANYGMVLAGNIVIGLGGVGFIAMVVGLGVRADAVTQRQALSVGSDPDFSAITRQDQRIHTATITAVTGGVAAGALFVTGITLVALGYDRERRRRVALPTAMVGPEGAGIGWSLRF